MGVELEVGVADDVGVGVDVEDADNDWVRDRGTDGDDDRLR